MLIKSGCEAKTDGRSIRSDKHRGVGLLIMVMLALLSTVEANEYLNLNINTVGQAISDHSYLMVMYSVRWSKKCKSVRSMFKKLIGYSGGII